MKKVLCVCAAALVLAFFSTSCNKKCQCTTYVNGVETLTPDPFEVESGKKCKDYNSEVTVLGVTTEVKCHATN